jgi:endonuclease/exonuclease/phosphatase (EEP) superfamily protein YafD
MPTPLLLAVLALTLGLLAFPWLVGAAGRMPIAQAISFRLVVALGLLLVAAIVLAPPGARSPRAALVVILLLGAIAQVGVLTSRGWSSTATTGSADGVVVLSFNTFTVVTPDVLARVVLDHRADVVVLPETTEATGRATAELLAALGRPMTTLARRAGDAPEQSTVLLVSTALGDYAVAEQAADRHATFRAEPVATPDDPWAPPIVAAHPFPPSTPGSMSLWRSEGAWVRGACLDTPGVIVAGDLNATLDHPHLRGLGPCVDAARAAGAAALGTWPASLPSRLSAPIDHILVDGRAWRVTSFAVLPATGGSDHRPVVAHLVRRDSPAHR